MKKRLQLFDQWRVAPSAAEAERLLREILAEAANEFEMIGVVRSPSDNAIRNQKLQNVYEQMLISWVYPNPAPTLPQQWFFSR